MWPDDRLCRLLGIRHPIIQAPMLGTCTPALAAAVSEAGGLGSYALGFASSDDIAVAAAEVRARTSRPFNLNFFTTAADGPAKLTDEVRTLLNAFRADAGLGPLPDLPDPPPAFGAAQARALAEARPAVASFHFGLPDADALAVMKDAGIRVLSSATCVAEARALEAAGVDAVIAQGFEAGGHRGSHRPGASLDGVGTMALVPQICDAVSVPVIAAGGIGDARGIRAAFALGASGVQMGTAFLRCPEAATAPAHRARVARARDTDTTVTRAISGRAARAVPSRFSEALRPFEDRLPPFPRMMAISGPLIRAGSGTDDPDASFLIYGQAAALSREMPAGDLVARLAAEAAA